jgi:hypothetical protein
MSITVITSVTCYDGRLTFHRASLIPKKVLKARGPKRDAPPTSADETLGIEIGYARADPIVVYLDQSREPLYGPHPEGGWVSPPWPTLTALQSDGVEVDELNHVRCRCHRSVGDSVPENTRRSLERTGHTDRCPKVQTAPVVPVETAQREGVVAVANGDVRPPGSPTPLPLGRPEKPPGGITFNQASDLVAALTGDNCSLEQGLLTVGVKLEEVDLRVIATSLFNGFGVSKCSKCGSWGPMGEGRICAGCS